MAFCWHFCGKILNWPNPSSLTKTWKQMGPYGTYSHHLAVQFAMKFMAGNHQPVTTAGGTPRLDVRPGWRWWLDVGIQFHQFRIEGVLLMLLSRDAPHELRSVGAGDSLLEMRQVGLHLMLDLYSSGLQQFMIALNLPYSMWLYYWWDLW